MAEFEIDRRKPGDEIIIGQAVLKIKRCRYGSVDFVIDVPPGVEVGYETNEDTWVEELPPREADPSKQSTLTGLADAASEWDLYDEGN